MLKTERDINSATKSSSSSHKSSTNSADKTRKQQESLFSEYPSSTNYTPSVSPQSFLNTFYHNRSPAQGNTVSNISPTFEEVWKYYQNFLVQNQ